MIDRTYALGTWEMHLWTKEEKNYISSKMLQHCKYIDTAIDYNNDYLLTPENGFGEYKIISKVSSYHSSRYDFFIDNHFKCLQRDKIDIMLIHSNRGDWQSLVKKIENDSRFIEVGVSNFTKDDIEKYKKIAGKYPAYNEVEINPYYTDVKTIEFCKKNGIKIIAYGVFGGKYNAMTYIADFSIPYLLSYAASFADIVILKPESYRQVNEIVDVITNYVDDGLNKIHMQSKLDSKSIEPMRYFAKDIDKRCLGFPTYTNWCGKNAPDPTIECIDAGIEVPDFEMLGDYLTYVRYMFRSRYDGSPVYYYDFLIADDGTGYAVYLSDKKDEMKLSKINKHGNVKIVRFVKKDKEQAKQ